MDKPRIIIVATIFVGTVLLLPSSYVDAFTFRSPYAPAIATLSSSSSSSRTWQVLRMATEEKVVDDPEEALAITKKLEGFVEILNTHSSTSPVKKDGNDEQLQQLSGTKQKEAPVLSSWSPWPEKGMVSIETAPTKSMTGVEPILFRLCQSISGQSYNAKSKTDYLFSDFETESFKPEVVICEMHKGFENTTPAFVVTIVGTTMILAWRGTHTLMDDVTDISFSVAASNRWKPLAGTIKVQAGFLSIVENDMVVHEDDIIKLIKDRGIKEVICTGHSLGGGIAQVCHLMLEAQLSVVDESPWKSLENQIVIRTVAIEAPMGVVFDPKHRSPLLHLLRGDDKKGHMFLEKCGANMCCTVYNNDVIPRTYGQVSWIIEMIDNLLLDVTGHKDEDKRIYLAKKLLFKILGGGVAFKERATILPIVTTMLRYKHLGKAIYYDAEKGTNPTPVVYNNFHELAKHVHYLKDDNAVTNVWDRLLIEHGALVKPWLP
mmetsp:Transcript_55250/g.61774  ORF Transcript_55250/g.61774 Transcript_55250/m.61774 type:complete len:489 (+) Transcript_55250:96-1562(+)